MESLGLKRSHEIPANCRELFITHGYRPVPCTATYCIRSLFSVTNETLNVWTHLIPSVLVLWYNISFLLNEVHNIKWNEPILLPFWFFVFSTAVMLFGSACAHLFSSMSAGIRETCYCFDYGFIAIFQFGVICVFTFYLCPYSCLLASANLSFCYPLLLAATLMTLAVVCYSRYPGTSARYIVRAACFAVMYFFTSAPCFYKFLVKDNRTRFQTNGTSSMVICNVANTSEASSEFCRVAVWLFLGNLINAAKIPERFFPGRFDIIGHSHQIFHVTASIAVYHKSRLVWIALLEMDKMRIQGDPEVFNLSWFEALFLPALFILTSCAIVYRFSKILYNMHENLKTD